MRSSERCKCVQLTLLCGQLGELVDMLHGVLAERNEEAKLKVEALEQAVLEVVPLNHAELVDRRRAYRELHPATQQ